MKRRKNHPTRLGSESAGTNVLGCLPGQITPVLPDARPGFWGVRELRDGQLLETELTKEEWDQLRAEAAERQRQIQHALNQHPLNQAARRRLEREGSSPMSKTMHVLEFVLLNDPEEGTGDLGLLFDKWNRTLGRQAAALEILEAGVTVEEIENDPLDRVSAYVCETLQAQEP